MLQPARASVVVLAGAVAACAGTIDDGFESASGGSSGAHASAGRGGSTVHASGGAGPAATNAPCRVAVPLRRLTELQIRNAVRDVFRGKASFAADFGVPTIGAPSSGFSNDAAYNAVDVGVARAFDDGALEVATSLVDQLAALEACAAASPGAACASTFIDDYGRRLFRRPVTADEKATLMAAYQLASGADAFKDGVTTIVATMLQSPQFLYEAEATTATPDGSGGVALAGYELASRLSFLLWDSVPDDALLAAAAAGDLASSEGVRKQAERLLADDRAKATIVRFAREWMRLTVPKPAERKDPSYATIADAVQSDLDGLVTSSFLGAGTVDTLLTAPKLATASLSSYYGAHGGVGPRSGLLTHPALMTAFASSADTSPIRRAVFVRKRLTCEEFPNPPNDAQTVDSMLPADATQRQRSEARTRIARCAGCHKLIDPLGFGFEAFDELGRYRTQLADGTPVDAHGDFVDPVTSDLAGPFDSVPQLGQRLAGSAAVRGCLSRQMFRFAFGRTDGDEDRCSIDALAGAVADRGSSLRELVLGLVSADEFRFRKVARP